METKAVAKYVRISPRKVRQVVDLLFFSLLLRGLLNQWLKFSNPQ